jgi:asparagine synthetase B (glutamine-hydrolysing)
VPTSGNLDGQPFLRLPRDATGDHSRLASFLLVVLAFPYRPIMAAAGLPVSGENLRAFLSSKSEKRDGCKSPALINTCLHPEFLRRTNLLERLDSVGCSEPNGKSQQRSAWIHDVCDSPMITHFLEAFDRTAAAEGLEKTFPFLDQRMVELCFALPSNARLKDGWTRVILRRAMKDTLPETVRWRTDKGNDGMGARLGLLLSREQLTHLICDEPEIIAPYFDIDALRAAYNRFVASPTSAATGDLFSIFLAASLARWLAGMEFKSNNRLRRTQ